MQLDTFPIAAAGATNKGVATESDYGIKSKTAYPNNRSTTKQDEYFGAIGGAFGAAVAPLLDVLRPTRKENAIGTLRPYQNAKTTVSNSYVYDPEDKPLPTIRETTETSKNHLNVNNGQGAGAYEITNIKVQQHHVKNKVIYCIWVILLLVATDKICDLTMLS